METIGPWTKGFWQTDPVPAAQWLAGDHHLFDGSLSWPVLTVDGAAVDHNVATMAAFAAGHGLRLAPHGKTSMAPALFRRQLAAGAWGITLATANQALAAHAAGIAPILIANEVLDPSALRWIAAVAPDVTLQVDSAAGIAALAAVADPEHPVPVLVELGHPEGRTGARDLPALLDLARRVHDTPGLRLAGVTAYEGGLPGAPQVREFLGLLREAGAAVAELTGGEVIVSAGGSAWFDLVAEVLGGMPGATVLLRSGSTITHDHGIYAQRTPFTRIAGELRPALRVWAQVTSRPEPGLAILGAGKRDLPYDEGLPLPLRVHRDGVAAELTGWTLTRTNDQHAYLEAGPGATALAVGDVVELGLSHPCTSFDKWRVVPVLDGDQRVTELLFTLF
ncbi:alanine racemase [Cellulomonas denverensis]|uniref:Alanine racemase n=1 Tax=Cellulomonas denverensis TaxID=264297 RepID=A0A7X6QXS8_9CELL|nr:alanine racemase [Cellulomonas denverensis]NKY21399.1 alanine racemase [Cellulomonas denverensis]GIG27034.1 alanine racemase [Cellulomonas denverensis]